MKSFTAISIAFPGNYIQRGIQAGSGSRYDSQVGLGSVLPLHKSMHHTKLSREDVEALRRFDACSMARKPSLMVPLGTLAAKSKRTLCSWAAISRGTHAKRAQLGCGSDRSHLEGWPRRLILDGKAEQNDGDELHEIIPPEVEKPVVPFRRRASARTK